MALAAPGILQAHIGPVPVWFAGAAVLAGVAVLGTRHRTAAQSAAPVAAANAPNPQMGTPVLLGAGASVYDPNSGQVATAPSAFGGDFFARLGNLFGGLANAPNAVTVTDPSGASVSWSNGVPTYGNGKPAVWDGGQWIGGLHAPSAEQAFYDYWNHRYDTVYGYNLALATNWTNFISTQTGQAYQNQQALAQQGTLQQQNWLNWLSSQNPAPTKPAAKCGAGTAGCYVG